MLKPLTACLTLAVLLAAPLVSRAEPARYAIDPEHLSISFAATHIGYADVLGLFLKGEGSFVYDDAARSLSDLTMTVRADSVFTNHDERDGHLKSGDFLDAEAEPEITFVMTGAEPTGETTGIVKGDLTLRGQTRPIEVEVRLNKAEVSPIGDQYRLGLTATTTVRRSDFGSTYAVDNGWVADAIPVRFEMEAVRQE